MEAALKYFLLGAFSFQSWLVYSDPTGRIDALSPEAAAGRTLWMQNGCQTCHQLHGFGGFLGPDLTNAAQHLTRARLDSVLTIGAGQMPAFGFSGSERAALSAFFDAMPSRRMDTSFSIATRRWSMPFWMLFVTIGASSSASCFA